MDTPATESTGPLSLNQAAALFGEEPVQEEKAPEKTDALPEPEKEPEKTAEVVQEPEAEGEKVTIEVDGKTVELTKAELADNYKNGLRQSDYTKKTMEAAEQRKAADADMAKAREERQKAAGSIAQATAVLQAQLQEQSQIDWHKLRDENPTEFLKQWHLYSERQAAFQGLEGQRQQLAAKEHQENKRALMTHLQSEHQALLDKLPEWKDAKKADAERQDIVKELIERGFPPERIFGEPDADGTPSLKNPGLTDHRILLMARDAMLYRKTMAQASAAAKKVTNLPQKVERPGVAETNPTDGRTTAMKQLHKSGSVQDAAAVFDRIFN